jgi:hypothetical protein
MAYHGHMWEASEWRSGSAAGQLSRERGCFIGEVAGEYEISCAQGVFSLGGEALGSVVLVARVGV